VAKRIGDRIETLMRVYAHWIPITNRDTENEAQKGTAPETEGGTKKARSGSREP
jgi:hypothetical protein